MTAVPEDVATTALRIGSAIAAAHADAFQSMMLDLIQRDNDTDPQPVRDAVLAALQPGDPAGPAAHIIDAVRTFLAHHDGVATELADMVADTSPLAMLAGLTGSDPRATAASSYALDTLRSVADATIAAICSMPDVSRIAMAASTRIEPITEPSSSGNRATAVARNAGLPLTFLAILLNDNGTVPMELAVSARSRMSA